MTVITKCIYIEEADSVNKVSVAHLTFSLYPLITQALASKTEDQHQSLQRLNELSEKLVSSSNNNEFAQEVNAVTDRVQAALPIVRDRSNRLSIMLQCFEHQQ